MASLEEYRDLKRQAQARRDEARIAVVKVMKSKQLSAEDIDKLSSALSELEVACESCGRWTALAQLKAVTEACSTPIFKPGDIIPVR